jgi:hypothetical protein
MSRRMAARLGLVLAGACAAPGGLAPPAARGEEAGTWWAFRPIARPAVPETRSAWPRTPIDRFVLAKLEENGLAPSPECSRRELIRRLTFDLTGLPPSPAEVAAFLDDPAPDAYERVVDRLLASPRHGERWARHWLDLVHYGDSHGYDKDKRRPNAWPYRDYVIRAFNSDKPYARFIEEQVAGDVLHPDDPDGIAAVGFLAAGPWDFVGHVELREGTVDKEITRSNDRDDVVATVLSTFASVTAHCARCHDHKFDPIPQADYYRLQAVFAGIDRADRPFDAEPEIHRRRRSLAAERKDVLARMEAPGEGGAVPGSDRAALEARIAAVDREIAALPPEGRVYAAASDFKPDGSFTPARGPRAIHILHRGDVRQPGKLVGPGALSVLPGLDRHFTGLGPESGEAERRAALARWLADPENPLVWRSIVNRTWHHHFGRGIVETPSDFGRMGTLPTHPELLDWLAAWFVENGGSLGKLHRLIVTSAAYRQSSLDDPAKARSDADNRFLWRMNRTRLDAESVRDAILSASGRLDLAMGGPADHHFAFKDDHSPVYDYAAFDPGLAAGRRRSIYRFIVRSVPDPFFECMDGADPSILTPKRCTTVTALQALALLNSPFAIAGAEQLAARLRAARGDAAGQVEEAFLLALGRPPSAAEAGAVGRHAAAHGLESACRVILNMNEFIFID